MSQTVRSCANRALLLLEVACFAGALYYTIKWICDGSGYEPWAGLFVVVGAGIELARRVWARPSKNGSTETTWESLIKMAEGEPLSNVFPKVLSFAKMRGHDDLFNWAKLEVGGYYEDNGFPKGSSVPEYRVVAGFHYDGFLRPLDLSNHPDLAFLNTTQMKQGLRELEGFAASTSPMFYQFDPGINKLINEHLGVNVVQFGFSASAIRGILERIRTEMIERLHAAKTSS